MHSMAWGKAIKLAYTRPLIYSEDLNIGHFNTMQVVAFCFLLLNPVAKLCPHGNTLHAVAF